MLVLCACLLPLPLNGCAAAAVYGVYKYEQGKKLKALRPEPAKYPACRGRDKNYKAAKACLSAQKQRQGAERAAGAPK